MSTERVAHQQTVTEMGLRLAPVRQLFRRVQRNHALEHATINILSRRYPAAQVMGFSGPKGFTLHSNLTAEEVIPAVRHALDALKRGESELAIHENCGTNLVITAVLTTLATILGLGCTRKSRLIDLVERLPQAVLLNAIAVLAAKPLGQWLQANMTTDAMMDDVAISSFFTDYRRGMLRIRVHTRQSRAFQA